MWMQPASADHSGPVRTGLREPVGTGPLCRVASHALFGPWLRSGSPPVPDGHKLPESADHASRNFRNSAKCRLVSRMEPAAIPAKSKTLNHGLTRMALRAFLSPIRVNPCNPWSNIPARPVHLANHAPKPPGSNHPLSRSALQQAGNKSSALAENPGATGNKSSLYRPTIKRLQPTPDRSQVPDRTSRCGTGYRERHSATGLRVVIKDDV